MTVLEKAFTALNPLATGGACVDVNETQPAPSEFIVFSRVVSVPNVSLGGSSNLQNTRLQVDVYARTRARAVEIDALVLPALEAAGFSSVVEIGVQDLYEPDTRLRRVSHDFSIWD